MESSRSESVTLVAAVIGATVLSSQQHGIGFGEPAIGDLAILAILFTFDSMSTRSGGQSIAFAGVSGFCLLTPLLFVANNVLGAIIPQGSSWMLCGLWLVLTMIMFAIDRFRMSARYSVSLAGARLSAAGPTQDISGSAPLPTYRPAPIRVEAAPQPAIHESVPTPPVVLASAPDFAATTISEAVGAPATWPDVTVIPPGREAVIYLNLVGEGLNVLRTVRAESLGRDYFRIADSMPEGEQWEFTPGMVVRCRKKSLSNGKQLVAYEEAPRAL